MSINNPESNIVRSEAIEATELEMTPEAKEIVELFRKARAIESEPGRIDAALDFVHHLAAVVDPREVNYGRGVLSPLEEARKRFNKLNFAGYPLEILQGRSQLALGSGTNGCRIFFRNEKSKSDPEKEEFYMHYPKPTERDEYSGGKLWKRYMDNFKREKIKLS